MNKLKKLSRLELQGIARNLGIDLWSLPLPTYDEFICDYPSGTRESFEEYLKEILLDAISDYPREAINLAIDIGG